MIRSERIIVTVLRVILALVFIFSGFVKIVDPWGTALKLGEYFTAYGVEWLSGTKYYLSILLSGTELALGMAMLFSVRLRITSLLVTVFMFFFTVLTLVSAAGNKVEDCGCFGDVLILTNWQTFFKNLVLLPVSVFVWLVSRRLPARRPWKADVVIAVFLLALSYGIGYYSILHLPPVDFLPYRKGTDLREARMDTGYGDVKTTLIYRDRQTGKKEEFDLNDTTWYDTGRWEYVDTRIVQGKGFKPSPARDFTIYDSRGDLTDEILSYEGETYILILSSLMHIPDECREKMTETVRLARHARARVICVTPAPISPDMKLDFGPTKVPCYNIDRTLMKTVIRANYGLVVLRDGVISDKKNCRDL